VALFAALCRAVAGKAAKRVRALRVDLVNGSMILYGADNDGRSSQVLHGQAFAIASFARSPKPSIIRLGKASVSNDDAHLLKVADGLRWTKQFIIRAQFIRNLDGSHTAPTEEIGSPSKKILAALQVEAGLVFTWNRLRTSICNRTE
jgi:hypothetical protein